MDDVEAEIAEDADAALQALRASLDADAIGDPDLPKVQIEALADKENRQSRIPTGRREAGMRGTIKKRYKSSWSITFDVGRDPLTGKRRKRWVTVKGTKKDAEDKLTEMLRSMKTNTYVDVSKMTVGQFIEEWFTVAKTELRAGTVERYQSIIDRRLKDSALARMPLQKVRPTNVEQYYASHASLAAGTLGLDHAILHSALAVAVRDRLITENPAANIRRKRRDRDRSIEAQKHAWSATDAAKFLAVAKKAGAQSAAFYTVALETGMRKSELGGLRWANVDLDGAKVQVVEQLTKKGSEPEWGPTKTGKPRTIAIGPETVALLREHRRAQAELKMKNRATYKDHGLVFAKEWGDVRRRGEYLGQPLQLNNIGQREYDRLIRDAGIRRIKFHGLRHTCATLLLQARTPVHVVSERLGHSKVTMTLEVYAHVLPDMQTEAAATLGALLHG